MGIRPGKTKGPYVGISDDEATLDVKAKVSTNDTTTDFLNAKISAGAGIATTILNPGANERLEISAPGSTTDEKVKNTGADTTADYLDSKVAAGTNVTKTTLNPGGNEQLQLSAADPTVEVTGADTTPGNLSAKIAAGTNITLATLNPGGNEQLQISSSGGAPLWDDLDAGMGLDLVTLSSGAWEMKHAVPTFWDDFDDVKPFWQNTEVINSADWSIDTTNDRLQGIAENNTYDRFRVGVEGDFDYAIKVDRNTATSIGIYILGNSKTVRISKTGSNLMITMTGRSDGTFALAGDELWLRIKRLDDDIFFYYKVNDNDPWTLAHTYADTDLLYTVDAALDSANGGYIYEMILYDNMTSNDVKSIFEHVVDLTDGATIAVDAALGNIFTVTLGGNRTLSNPTNPNRGQKIIIRVKQDGTGSRTLSFDTKYRFSTDLPSPTLSTTGGKTDYLGFIYNKDDDKWDYIAEVKGF